MTTTRTKVSLTLLAAHLTVTDPELRAFADDEEGELGSDEEAASGEERVDDDEGSDAGYDSKSTTASHRFGNRLLMPGI